TRRASTGRSGCALLAAESDIVGVDDDEKIEQAGRHHKRIAIFVGHRAHLAGADPKRARDEVRDSDSEIGNARKPDERVRQLEWKEAALNRQTDCEHERERDKENQSFRSASLP